MVVEQPIAHIMSIVGHFRARTSLAKNYSQLFESYMIMAGIQDSPLVNTAIIQYVDAPWLEVTRTFLRENNIIIRIPVIPKLLYLRKYDKTIMEIAEKQSSNLAFLKAIHKCRLYLQIMFLSEICNSEGTCILKYFRVHISMPNYTPTTYSTSTIHFPTQSNPPAAAWIHWRKFLQQLVKPLMKVELQESLGDWTDEFNKYRKWK